MAHALQYSCLENPFSDREAWQAPVYRVAKSRTGLKRSCAHKYKTFFSFFFACGTSALVRVECEGGADAWLAGTLVAQSVQGHRLPPRQELCPIRDFFLAACSWRSEGLFGPSLSIALPVQALRGLSCLGALPRPTLLGCFAHQACSGGPLTGVLLCRSAHQALKGAPWVGSYSVVQCLSRLVGQPLCSAAYAGMRRERLW